MLILNAEECRQVLPMSECIAGMKEGFRILSEGNAILPLRSRISVQKQEGISLFMPAYLPETDSESLVIKIVSVFNKNPEQNLPLIHAAVLVLDEETGQVAALIEGASLTAIRTGAASGAATDLLARKDAEILAVFGAGVQAATQLEAVCEIRDIKEVRIFSPNAEQTQAFIDTNGGQGKIPANVFLCDDPRQALQGADIICTATTSSTPVFDDTDLSKGVHINAVGSYTPDAYEIPMETLGRARVFVDSMDAAGVESGEISQGLANGILQTSEILEIGQALIDESLTRNNADEITMFKSVGIAVQDAVAGKIALENARKLGLGREISL